MPNDPVETNNVLNLKEIVNQINTMERLQLVIH